MSCSCQLLFRLFLADLDLEMEWIPSGFISSREIIAPRTIKIEVVSDSKADFNILLQCGPTPISSELVLSLAFQTSKDTCQP
jgi:hypothetical protein